MPKTEKVEKAQATKSEARKEKKSAVEIQILNQTAYDKLNAKRETIEAANLYVTFRGRDNYNKAHLSFDCTREVKLFAQAKQLDENRLKSATRNIAVSKVELRSDDILIAYVKTREDFMKIESYTTFELFNNENVKLAVYEVSQHKDPRRTEVAIFNSVKAMILEVVEKPARLLTSELSQTVEAQAATIEAQEIARKALEAQVAEMLEKFAKLEAQASESETNRIVESA